MPKVKLDYANIMTLTCEKGKRKTDFWDEALPGFTMEIRANGGRTFYLRYQDKFGKQRQYKICAFGDLSIDKIRKEAQRLRSEVVLGGDPAGQKAEVKSIPTYTELAAQHLAHAKTYQRSYDTTRQYCETHLLPRFGKLRLTEIKQQDVAKWLADKRAQGLAPATVEKMRLILGRSFELAARWGIAGSEKNPARGISRPPIDNARSRYLSVDEAKRLRQAVELSRNTQLKHIVGLLLLTGARVSELLNARWEHVDLERKLWLIPKAKTKARHVPLSQAAIDILEQVPRFDGCPYVLPNPVTREPFTEIKHAWQHARDKAKLPGLRIHDLRHSAASFMINAGVDLFAVGRVLGHADHKSTMRYSHLANDTLLAAVEAGAAKLSVDWAGHGV